MASWSSRGSPSQTYRGTGSGLERQAGSSSPAMPGLAPCPAPLQSFHRPRSQLSRNPGSRGTSFPHLGQVLRPFLPPPLPPVSGSLQAFRCLAPTPYCTGTREGAHTLATPCTWEEEKREGGGRAGERAEQGCCPHRPQAGLCPALARRVPCCLAASVLIRLSSAASGQQLAAAWQVENRDGPWCGFQASPESCLVPFALTTAGIESPRQKNRQKRELWQKVPRERGCGGAGAGVCSGPGNLLLRVWESLFHFPTRFHVQGLSPPHSTSPGLRPAGPALLTNERATYGSCFVLGFAALHWLPVGPSPGTDRQIDR